MTHFTFTLGNNIKPSLEAFPCLYWIYNSKYCWTSKILERQHTKTTNMFYPVSLNPSYAIGMDLFFATFGQGQVRGGQSIERSHTLLMISRAPLVNQSPSTDQRFMMMTPHNRTFHTSSQLMGTATPSLDTSLSCMNPFPSNPNQGAKKLLAMSPNEPTTPNPRPNLFPSTLP